MQTRVGARYDRQIILPEIGLDGQARLREARIYMAGAGGLASTAAYYLAAAGVGTLGIADDDRVEITNLNRQILHGPNRIGTAKVASARQTLTSFNPEINVIAYPVRLDSAPAMAPIIREFDAVVDCTDNFDARETINQACIMAVKPWVYGAVRGFEGQVMTIVPGSGPCYRCLYPASRAEASLAGGKGVIGISPGTIGIIQAAEIIKYILGKGRLLIGRMLHVDLLDMQFCELRIGKNQFCTSCGSHGSKDQLY